MAGEYRFSFGPWNIHEGGDPFGPTVRRSVAFGKKLKLYKRLGFDGVQFHDDDAVPGMDKLTARQIIKQAKEVRKMLDGEGLAAEFVAPRLWENPQTIDGGYTSNDPACRKYARDRSRRTIDSTRGVPRASCVMRTWRFRSLGLTSPAWAMTSLPMPAAARL